MYFDMAEDYSKLINQRPALVQQIEYVPQPDYYPHKSYEDKLAILVCRIKIWKPEGNKWFDIPSAENCVLTIRECESIEINESCKDLIGKAVVRFPRGTVISKSSNPEKKVKTGNIADNTLSEQSLKDATNSGEVITKESSQYSSDGVSTTSIAINYDDKGLIEFNRTVKETALLNPNDIAIGNRIEIRLGYAYSETEYNQMNLGDSNDYLDLAFTGFITSVSPQTPLEIECTNMGHILASVGVPNISGKGSLTVKDFLDDNGTYHLLQNTGISLAEASKESDIEVSGGTISENLTIADVLAAWTNAGVLSVWDYKKDGRVELRVGLTYYAGQGGGDLPNNDKKYITYNGGNNTIKLLQFDWDVAEDNLSFKFTDKKYLAIQAIGMIKDAETFKFFKLTIRKNPDTDDEGWIIDNENGTFQVVNIHEVKDRKNEKKENGSVSTKSISTAVKNKVQLSKYDVLTYQSRKINITEDELIEEAKQYWAKCTKNGLSGNIKIFGDVVVRPTEIIGLIDPRAQERNGYYFVEAVNTYFGINGYRRQLTIPYKIASFPNPVKII